MKIDGVFSGGGVKGFALIGAYQVMEEKGFSFQRVAGTSAGAIIAGFSAAGFTGSEMQKMMEETNLRDFMDTRKTLLPLPLAKWLLLYWRLGIYRGLQLEEWLEKKLASKGIFTFLDLPEKSLQVVASDLTNGRMLVLPDDLERYGIPKETFPVARAIRMSCGIPYFFEPVKLRSVDGVSVIVDGGVLSNFPMWLFDQGKTKLQRPVVGVKLSHYFGERPKTKIQNGIQLFEALFSTMRDAHDSRYISRKQEKNIIFIPTTGFESIEFDLTEKKKEELIALGRKKTLEFLQTWTF
ncbi:patatin-like phospholipase family protein [Bacillus chungangensis]|uniref:NTE family protein n=1 Tax=Bacillus chungangensis TaxID=587633 RepID=A0ABT9WPE1_9BACI|nr:patatin-like phospholipase family protein [Bacillus chungangensis]MDQ0175153.1 NTE family protein [Bacillus chungangensis]